MSEGLTLFGQSITRVHAIGVGGMGLGPLAIYLAQRGLTVSGEDDALSAEMRLQLKRGGVSLEAGAAESADLVVISSAIKPEHSSMIAATERGALIRRRGEVLAEIGRDRRLVAVAGSHGKTSVTAMLIHTLKRCGVAHDYVLGGLWADPEIAPAAAASGNEWLVAEIDESDGTIDGFSPAVTTIVNFDWDHADRYQVAEELQDTFAALAERTKGAVLVPAKVAVEIKGQVQTFGLGGDYAVMETSPIATGQQLTLGGLFTVDQAKVSAWGAFNAANAVAALATAETMGASLPDDVLVDFPGVHRRQQVLSRVGGVTVLEDYAHHPHEIATLLAGVREQMQAEGRMVVVFQPHRFTRTRQFLAEFGEVLGGADALYLLDVYGAGEKEVVGGTTRDLAEHLRVVQADKKISYRVSDAVSTLADLSGSLETADWVVFVGAGDIEHTARSWVAERSWDALAQRLREQLGAGTKVLREETLATKTTIRIGGPARIYVEPASVDDLQTVLREANAAEAAVFMLGRGSNLLVPDEGVEGVVVSLRRAEWETFEQLADGRVKVGAGLRLKNLCGLAAKDGLVGFEFLEGIPGNVGGALRMNAGAMGGWMFDVVDEVEALTMTGERQSWRREDLHVGYRHCRELESAIAVSAILQPHEVSEAEKVGRQIDVYRAKRQESQPREPSAGCIFKNPEGDSAGRLIDVGGLKGMQEGSAEVSGVHGNFIINRGGARCADVIQLVRRVRSEVKSKSGVELQPEVLLFGTDWKDQL